MRRFILILVSLPLFFNSYCTAQDCDWIDTPPACICDAPTACGLNSLDNVCFTLNLPSTQPTFFPGCLNGQLNNPAWFSFQTSTPSFDLYIEPSNCNGIGQNNAMGIQAALIARNTMDPIECEDPCFTTLFNDFIILDAVCNGTVEPFVMEHQPGNPFFTYYLVIDGNGGDICDVNIQVQPLDDSSGTCWADSLLASPYNCGGDSVDLYLSVLGGDYACADSVTLLINGDTLGTIAPQDLPLLFEGIPVYPDSSVLAGIVSSDSSCMTLTLLESINCNDCGIEEMAAGAGGCTTDSTYVVEIGINLAQIHSDSLIVYTADHLVGIFHADEFPLRLTEFPWYGEDLAQITVCEVNRPDECCYVDFITTPECLGPASCPLSYLVAEPHACDGDSFLVDIDLMYSRDQTDSFILEVDGNIYGQYTYEDLYLTVGPFEGNGHGYEFTVITIDSPSCTRSVTTDEIDCTQEEDCSIRDITYDIVDCSEDSFFIILDFIFEYVGDQGFVVLGNGMTHGEYEYEDLPITIGPLARDDTAWEFIIEDNAHPDCDDEIGLGQVDCGDDACSFFDIVADPGECTSDSTYTLHLNFEYEGVTNDFFDVWVNGEYFDFFPYTDLPITIEHFPTSGGQVDWVKICDNDNPDCCAEYEWPVPDCIEGGDDECHIYDLSYDIVDCTKDSFYIILNFLYDNVGENGFSIVGGGYDHGDFEYADVPVTLGPLSRDEVWEFVIIDNDNGDCRKGIDVGEVECDDECEIYELVVDPGDCTSDSTYELYVDFDYEGVNNDFFDLYANGEFFGFYEFSQLPLTIENFPTSGNSVDWLEVCENDHPDCCKGAEWDVPECLTTSNNLVDLDANIEVYPNPASAELIIKTMDVNTDLKYSIISTTGQIMRPAMALPAGRSRIDLGDIPAGIYFLSIQNDRYSSTRKISIIK